MMFCLRLGRHGSINSAACHHVTCALIGTSRKLTASNYTSSLATIEYKMVDANGGIQKFRVEPATRSGVATCLINYITRHNFSPTWSVTQFVKVAWLFTRGLYESRDIKCCCYVHNNSLGIKFSLYAQRHDWRKIFPLAKKAIMSTWLGLLNTHEVVIRPRVKWWSYWILMRSLIAYYCNNVHLQSTANFNDYSVCAVQQQKAISYRGLPGNTYFYQTVTAK